MIEDQDREPSAIRGRNILAESAMQLARALPDHAAFTKDFDPSEVEWLTALKSVASNFSTAGNWTDSEARAYLDSLRFAQAALRYAAARAGSGQAGGLLDCLVRCNAGVDPCVRSCRTIECLLGCQSEFFDCAKGCVTEAVRDILARNGSDGGKASPARPGRRRTEKKGVGD